VNFAGKLERRARSVARRVLAVHRNRTARGPRAVYAGILDGERLWLAVDREAGEPALLDVSTGDLVRPVSDLPEGHAETEPSFRSVRWPLSGVLPASADAEFEVVVVRGRDGHATTETVRVETLPDPPGPNRTLDSDDPGWQFILVREPRGALRVRRRQRPSVARVVDAQYVNRTAAITVEPLGRESAELLMLDQAQGVVLARLPMEATDRGFRRVIVDADVPTDPGPYFAAFGTPEDHVPIVRRNNDLFITDPGSALLPVVTEHGGDADAVRLRFGPEGMLRFVRPQPEPLKETTA
jgi:hypothetical protein